MSLTPKQKRVLDFVEAYFAEHRLMPSRREIAEGLGLSSVATVQEHIEALERNGYLKRGLEGSARAVSLAAASASASATSSASARAKLGAQPGGGASLKSVSAVAPAPSIEYTEPEIPLLGRVAAGFPIEVFAQQRALPLSSALFHLPNGSQAAAALFALEVQGDSMRDDGILEGDIVVLEKKATARSGETVVALWNGEATLKRYVRGSRKEGGEGTLELHPANPKYPVLKVQPDDRFEIQGVLRGVIRTYGKSGSYAPSTIGRDTERANDRGKPASRS